MTPEERMLIQDLGIVVINNFGSIVTSGLLQDNEDLAPEPQKSCFVLNIMGLASILAIVAVELRAVFLNSLRTIDVKFLQSVNNELFAADIITTWSAEGLLVVVDCIVVWRAWVLYFDRKWIMILPLLLLATTSSLSLASVILGSRPSLIIASDTLGFSTILGSLENASLYTSLATNVVATLLILGKFWEHRKVLRQVHHHKKISGASRALLILIEAGAFYIILEVFTIFSDTVNFPSAPLLNQVTNGLFQEMAGMYPIIVTLLIQMRRSQVETLEFSTLPRRGAIDVEASVPDNGNSPVEHAPLSTN
ncbi:hypothetical protein H0H92_007577 [Tricholoma furcatifolium]|nr:hypothetical protein H0H92_007577 [Tricholoma furcatifolium]